MNSGAFWLFASGGVAAWAIWESVTHLRWFRLLKAKRLRKMRNGVRATIRAANIRCYEGFRRRMGL